MRKNCGEISVTSQAPAIDPAKPVKAAGSRAAQRSSTRLAYCAVATAVPQIDAPLLTPNSVAGWVVGKAANRAGTSTRPPPPTMASTNPASKEAQVTKMSSMRGLCQAGAAASGHKKSAGVTSAFSGPVVWTGPINLFLLDFCVSSAPRVAGCMARRQVSHYRRAQELPLLVLSRGAARPGTHSPAVIQAAAFSAIIRVGELVLPLVMSGITPASTTRSPLMPRTRRCESTTAIGSSALPILVVPTG